MRKILLFISLSLLLSCSHSDFTLMSATRQDWSAGPVGKGTGSLYEFMIQVKTVPLVFDTVWIGKQPLKVKTLRSLTAQEREVMKNDTIILSGTMFTNKPIQPNDPKMQRVKDSAKIISPVYTGKALIVYKKGDSKKTFAIDSIKLLPKIVMP